MVTIKRKPKQMMVMMQGEKGTLTHFWWEYIYSSMEVSQ
jgi:hypothetical protein